MDALFADLRYGIRLLVQRPGITAIALVTLAIGVGANTAIFSVVNGVLLEPLPYPEPEELVTVWQDHTRIDGPATEWASPDNFFDWRDQNEVFGGMFALSDWVPTLTGVGEPEQLAGAVLSHNGLSLLGLMPILGRGFRPEEDRASSELVVVLGHSLWARRFSSDGSVLGKTIALGEETATIVGVLPPDVEIPFVGRPEIVAPLRIDPSNSCGRGCVSLRVVARLADGVPLSRARTDMDAIAIRLEREHANENRGVGVTLLPLREQITGDIRPALLALLVAVTLVLLIACANVASLLLARAADREREVATRMAMGASRLRLVRQLLTESLLLAILGAALGVVLALWGVDVLRSLVPESVPRLSEVAVDLRVLGFTLVVALATGLLFGLVPALRASRPDLNRSLKEGARGSTTGGATRLRSVLVVSQVALALTLLVGASLLLRSFEELTRVDPGFRAENVLTAAVNLSGSRYEEAGRRRELVTRLLAEIETLPGVEGAAVVNALPMAGADSDAGFLIEGREPPEPNRGPVAWYRSVSPDYFSTLTMRLVRGRWFRDGEDARATPVVLINETAARRYWPNEDPLLSRVRIGGEWRHVVGIVADTKHFGLDSDDRAALYFPYDQIPLRILNLVVRTGGGLDGTALAGDLRLVLSELDPLLALSNAMPLEDVVSRTVSAPRVTASLFGAFALFALALAAIGLFGILSYGVRQQAHEIGIRMALGAERSEVLRSVVGHGMRLLGAGAVFGLAAASSAPRLLGSLLFGVSPWDPAAFVVAAAVLTIVGLAASYLPARRAARVDPIVALRYE